MLKLAITCADPLGAYNWVVTRPAKTGRRDNRGYDAQYQDAAWYDDDGWYNDCDNENDQEPAHRPDPKQVYKA